MKKILISLLITLMCLSACANKIQNEEVVESDIRSDDIVILFTNDIHCGIDKNLTLASLSAYKKYMQTKSKNVLLVDCGDAIQGSTLGAVSRGEIIIDAMNIVGYDYCIFGNHEFDYGTDQLDFLLKKANAKYINTNVKYIGSKDKSVIDNTIPYAIVDFDGKKVAFLGITTPNALSSSTIINYKEDDKIVYDFARDNDGQDLYDIVQKNIDEVKNQGADYVVVLAHLGIGTGEKDVPFTATKLINNTKGIDVLLDGHSHSIYQHYGDKNKDDDYIISAQTGTQLQTFGQLVISKDGTISVAVISDFNDIDEETKKAIDNLSADYSEELNAVVGHSDFRLNTTDEDGVRLVRNRETNLGDFVADAIRYQTEAQIAYVNGGGIRTGIEIGDITLKNMIDVSPFENYLCTCNIKGQELLDLLELWCSSVKKEYVNENGEVIGESGSFPQLSGLKITINTDIPSSVVLDENNALLEVGETRRISDVLVEENGEYVPIDPNKTYLIGASDYIITQGGAGTTNILKNHETVSKDICYVYEAFIDYACDELHGDFSRYEFVDDRITIK